MHGPRRGGIVHGDRHVTGPERSGDGKCPVNDEVRGTLEQHAVLAARRLALAAVHNDSATAMRHGPDLVSKGESCTPASGERHRVEQPDEPVPFELRHRAVRFDVLVVAGVEARQ